MPRRIVGAVEVDIRGMVLAKDIKELREKTGAGIADVKKALEESGGDAAKAELWLERNLGSVAVKKASRETKAGVIEMYLHSNGRISSMVELFCETDFVARNQDFKKLAHDLAMHIAATSPLYVSLDSVPASAWDAEKIRFEEEVAKMDKPENIKNNIVSGKLKTHFGGLSLLSQPFVKDEDRAVGDIVNEAIGRFGENIKVGRFARFEI